MRGREDPLGALLARAGALSPKEVSDLLELQRQPWPIASLAYVLGLADEETLVRALAAQLGDDPAVVLDRSAISLEVLDGAAPELALEHGILPLAEDRQRLLVACERPSDVRDVLRELEFIKGKSVVAHVALKVTLERTVRACQRARARGVDRVAGPGARPDAVGPAAIAVVGERPSVARGSSPERMPEARPGRELEAAASADGEDITREVSFEELVAAIQEETAIESDDALVGGQPGSSGVAESFGTEPSAPPVRPLEAAPVQVQDSPSGSEPLVSSHTAVAQIIRRGEAAAIELIDLDGRDGAEYRPQRGSPGRVLLVDDDFASRQLLVKELAPLGYELQTAEHGGEALARITGDPPDVIVVDILLPEVDGFHICRAVKQSRKYSRIAVVLISAMIDSGRVTDEVLRRYGADAYFEKPLDIGKLKVRLQELMVARGAGESAAGQQCFERAMSFYRAGEIDAAVGELRRGIEEDPMSAKHHFVLANILHKKALIFEAIDEYEATLELKPDYFPALTRLAYLYYKQGYSVRAIDTWRRSLPLCTDPGLRHNIELFMRKLIAEMGDR